MEVSSAILNRGAQTPRGLPKPTAASVCRQRPLAPGPPVCVTLTQRLPVNPHLSSLVLILATGLVKWNGMKNPRVKQLNCTVTLFKVKQVRASPTSLSRPGTAGYQWHGGAETTGCGPNAVDGHIISGLQSINMPLCFYEA